MASNCSFKIKNIEVKSKFFFAPINTGLASNGNPTEDLLRFHGLRANEYTGINYVGNVAIDMETVTNNNTLFINPTMKNYSELAATIKKDGSIPGVQIACFKSKLETQRNWKNSNTYDYIGFVKNEIGSLSVLHINLKTGITFSIGRSIIADHDFLKKHFENNMQDIVECCYRNECHYYTLKKNFIECGVNKSLY